MNITVFLKSDSLINIECDMIKEEEGVITFYRFSDPYGFSDPNLIKREMIAQFTITQIKGWALTSEVTKTKLA